jgi:hypothetical protein
MTHRRWWWLGFLVVVGALGGCGGGGHDEGPHGGGCLLVQEVEPNTTPLTAQFLGDLVIGDCVAVAGALVDPADEDNYRVLLQESLTLTVTLDHSPFVDFDLQLFEADTGQLIRDCGSPTVPEVCTVPFVVPGGATAVDVVVTPVSGLGSYTLTLDAH